MLGGELSRINSSDVGQVGETVGQCLNILDDSVARIGGGVCVVAQAEAGMEMKMGYHSAGMANEAGMEAAIV